MIIKIISSKILTVGELFKFSIFKFSDLDAVAVLVAIVRRRLCSVTYPSTLEGERNS